MSRKREKRPELHPLEKLAKRHFGVTQNLEETGYVLSDGTFLDLSGRHYATGYVRRGDRFVPKPGQPDYLYGQRNIDHRKLPGAIQRALKTEGGSATMRAFLRETGAIRFMPGTGFLVARMPTVESVAAILSEWHHAFGRTPLYIDIVGAADVEDSVELEEPTLEGVMEFLEHAFSRTSMGTSLGNANRRLEVKRSARLHADRIRDFEIELVYDPKANVWSIRSRVIGNAGYWDMLHPKKFSPERPEPWEYYRIPARDELEAVLEFRRTVARVASTLQALPIGILARSMAMQEARASGRDPDVLELEWRELLEEEGEPPALGAAKRGTPETLEEFGRELRDFLNQDDVLSILREGDWGSGGCWVLAEALVQWLGPPAELVGVSESRRRRGGARTRVPISHVAVNYGDVYIDYNGAHDKQAFLAALRREGYDNPKIVPWTQALERSLRDWDVPCEPWQVKRLVTKLHERFPET